MSETIVITKTIQEKSILSFTKGVIWLLNEYPYLTFQEALIQDASGQVEFTARFRGEFIGKEGT